MIVIQLEKNSKMFDLVQRSVFLCRSIHKSKHIVMKKALLLLVVILSMNDLLAKGFFPFNEVNKEWSIGIIGGYVGYGRGISNGAVGVSLAIKGFYAGVMGWPSSHENDMGVGKWSDKTSAVVHIGYQIPIVKNLRFIPVIGYAKIAYGTTDGSDYTISDSGVVHNKFSEKKSVSGLDFGGVAVVNIKKVNINLAFTKYSILGGIALEF